MSNTAIVDAIIKVLLSEVVPRWRAELMTDPRTGVDPGLCAATAVVNAWLADLRRNRRAALQSDRLAEALRRTWVCALGRGKVCVSRNSEPVLWAEISPADLALVETVREIAATLDPARGTSVATQHDADRDAVLTRAFEMARRAAASASRRAAR